MSVLSTPPKAPTLAPGQIAYTGNQWFSEVHAPNVVDTRTVINGIKVPPMPDAKINDATIAGVDTDHNGIRDDVDRALAELFGGDMRQYQSAYAVAKMLEDVISHHDNSNVKDYGHATKCFTHQMRMKLVQIELLATNTPARNAANSSAFAGWSGSGSTKDCPNEQEIRNSYRITTPK